MAQDIINNEARQGSRPGLRLAALVLCAILQACATTGPTGSRPVAIEPFKSIGIAATATATVLHLHPEAGAPRTLPLTRQSMADPSLTWLGHSSFLLCVGGKVLLTDPIFSTTINYHLPVTPKRIAAAPAGFDKLERLDAILISHVDHDHFDLPTLQRLSARFPGAHIYLPPGTQKLGHRAGFAKVHEVEIWQTAALGTLRLTALPAKHYGRRDVIGVERTIAMGWEIAGAGPKIYFSGDTAYSPIFHEIRKRRGRFPIALVPIGAYGPENLFADVHINPEDALLAASQLGARTAIAHHWGTFNLGAESPGEAKARFLAAKAPGVSARVLDIGETLRLR